MHRVGPGDCNDHSSHKRTEGASRLTRSCPLMSVIHPTRQSIFSLLATLVFAFFSQQAWSCKPPPGSRPPSLEEKFVSAEVVGVGVASGFHPNDPVGASAHMGGSKVVAIERYLKSSGPERVAISGFGGGNLCLTDVLFSSRFIFFGRWERETGRIQLVYGYPHDAIRSIDNLSALLKIADKVGSQDSRSMNSEKPLSTTPQQEPFWLRPELVPSIVTAAGQDYSGEVASLVARGVDVNEKDRLGRTALMMAAFHGGERTIKLLLGAGASVQDRDGNGATALHYGARSENTVELLVGAGADVRARDLLGQTPLHWSVMLPIPYVYSSGMSRQDVEAAIESKFEERARVVEALVRKGAEIGSHCKSGMTPLHLARNRTIASALLKAGADVRLRNEHGFTPLMSIVNQSPQTFQLLLASGSDLLVRTNRAETILHLLAGAERPQIDYLARAIQSGISIDAQEVDGDTALHRAVKSIRRWGCDSHAVSYLLSKGANPLLRNIAGKTPIGNLLETIRGSPESRNKCIESFRSIGIDENHIAARDPPSPNLEMFPLDALAMPR